MGGCPACVIPYRAKSNDLLVSKEELYLEKSYRFSLFLAIK